MIRTLAIITGAGLVLSIACFAGAAALGGADLQRNGWTWTLESDEHGDGGHFVRGAPDAGPDTTRTVAWTGGESLEIEVPVDVTYIQGPAATVVITGPKSIADWVRVEGGRITMDDPEGRERVTFSMHNGSLRAWSDTDRVKITITAPAVKRFDLEGSSDLLIEGYDQDAMSVDISGSGEVTARGRTRALTLDISGSGEADLADLQTTDAAVDIAGSGEARVAPTGAATVTISGSGDVDLTTRPTSLRTSISGSGDVDELG